MLQHAKGAVLAVARSRDQFEVQIRIVCEFLAQKRRFSYGHIATWTDVQQTVTHLKHIRNTCNKRSDNKHYESV